MRFTPRQIDELNRRFSDKGPEEIVSWAVEKLHPKVALATSFQVQGSVLIDILMKADPRARIFTLDTGRLNPETYEMAERVREKYGARVEVVFPDSAEVGEMVSERGVNLFYRGAENRRLCCEVRKVRPLGRYLEGMDGWMTSLRSEQTRRRADAKKFESDSVHGGILKINPIVDWTEKRVWDYVKSNGVPYNALHDRGYPSIGCAPCTRAVAPGDDPRSGRWWWETGSDKECGIHFAHEETPAVGDKD